MALNIKIEEADNGFILENNEEDTKMVFLTLAELYVYIGVELLNYDVDEDKMTRAING